MFASAFRKLATLVVRRAQPDRAVARRTRAVRVRPRLLQLEDRTLPATVFWTNPAGGDWAVPANWSTGALPTSADDVVIDVPDVSPTITHSTGTDSVRTLISQEPIAFSGGSLTLPLASQIDGDLNFSGGTLTSGDILTVNGLLTWTTGTFGGTGRIRTSGGLTLSGGSSRTLNGATLDNAGTATWTGAGGLSTINGAVLNNLAGATFDVQTDAMISPGFSGEFPARFSNTGTFRTSAGSSATTVGVRFDNSGTVEVQTGTLQLSGGGSHSGAFTVASGAALTFTGGTHTLGASTRVSGVGTVNISGLFEHTTNFAGTYALTGDTNLIGGLANFLTDTTLSGLNLGGGILTGPASVVVEGPLNWTAGTMTGPGRTVARGGMTISGAATKTLSVRTLDNAGTATWTGTGSIEATGTAVFNNLAGATFDAQTSAPFGIPLHLAYFNNVGTFRKSASGTLLFGGQFNNSGTLDEQSGTLFLFRGGISSGTFRVAAGARLDLAGIHSLTASSLVTGAGAVGFGPSAAGFYQGIIDVAGTYNVSGATEVTGSLSFISDASIPTLNLSGGTLAGPGQVTVTSRLTWTAGTMAGPGRTRVLGELVVSGAGVKALDGRALDNAGTAIWSGTGDLSAANGAALNNLAGALFDVQNDATFSVFAFGLTPRFNNAGVLRKSSGTGTTIFGPLLDNSGILQVQAGTLRLTSGGTSGGAFVVAAGATLDFAGGGFLNISSLVTGAGTVILSGGTATLAGAYNVGGSTNLTGATVSFYQNPSIGTLTFSSGILAGPADVTVNGLLTWTAGTMSGPGRTRALGGLALSGSGSRSLDGRILDNGSTATWTGTGSLSVSNGAALNNLAGALFDLQSDVTLAGSVFGGSTRLTNAGTLRKSAGNGTATFGLLFDNSGRVEVQAGMLRLAGGTAGGSFVVAAGTTLDFGGNTTLNGSSSVTGAGTVSFSNGTTTVGGAYNLSGTTRVVGGTASLNQNATSTGTLTLSGGSLAGLGDITVTGMLTWTGGAMRGPGRTVALGGLAISGAAEKHLSGRVLDNAAAATWTGTGFLRIDSAATFNNLPGATFEVRDDTSAGGSIHDPPSTFNNRGTFRKSAGAGTTEFYFVFNNSGGVEVHTGRLILGMGGASSGSFTVAAGADLTFAGGNHVLGPNSAVTGAGDVTLGDRFDGTVNIAGTYDITGLTSVVLGTADFIRSARTGRLRLSGGVLTGIGAVTATGTFTWTEGNMTGPGRTVALGGIAVSGLQKILDGRALDNGGTGTVSGFLTLASGGTLNNLPGGLLNLNNASFSPFGRPPEVINNAGTLRKSGGGTQSIPLVLNNSGTVEVQAGTLELGSVGLSSGAFLVAAGGTLAFAGGRHILGPSSTIRGAGTVMIGGLGFSSPLFSLAGTYQVDGTTAVTAGVAEFSNGASTRALTLSGGTLQGPGDLTVTGEMVWTGGTMAGPGRTRVEGSLVLSTSQPKVLDGRTLDHAGTGTWIDAVQLSMTNGAAFNNLAGATIEMRNSASFFSTGTTTFHNAGTLRKSASSATASIAATFTNTGTLDIQNGTLNLPGPFTNFSAGTGTLTGGSYQVASILQFNGADVRVSAAALVLDGPASRIVNPSGADGLANFADNTAAGSFRLRSGRSLSAPGPFRNEGSLTIDAGSTFRTVVGDYTQTSGATTVNGSLDPAGLLDIQDGLVSGSGILLADVRSAGRLSPGRSAGILTVAGSYTQLAAGILDVELGGRTAGTQYDRLAVSGTAILDGTLNVALIDGFTPVRGDRFQVLTFDSRSGDFAIQNGLDVGSGLYLIPTFDDTGLTLVVGLPGRLRFSSAVYSFGERAGSVAVTVVRTPGDEGPVSVRVATGVGTAEPGADYTAAAEVLRFAAVETSKTFAIALLNDALAEGNETFTVMLSNPTGGAALDPPSAVVVTIRDDDSPLLVFGPDAGMQPRIRALLPGGLAERFNFLAFGSAFTGGVRVAAGDISGDGLPEIIAASGPGMPAEVRIFDGASPGPVPDLLAAVSLFPGFSGGLFVAAGDLTGDGRADLVISPDRGLIPLVVAIDGANGSLLGVALVYDPTFSGGVRIAVADIDNDGRADLVTVPGPGRPADVQVFSGLDGSLLRSYRAFDAAFTGGAFVAAGDVNGDGSADLVVGADTGPRALVRVFDSTADGPMTAPIREFIAYSGSGRSVRVALRDLNGDGLAEVVTVPGSGLGPQARWFDPLTGDELGSAVIYDSSFRGGLFVAG